MVLTYLVCHVWGILIYTTHIVLYTLHTYGNVHDNFPYMTLT